MPRLGELLVEGGLLTTEQVDQALRAQVMWGGRFGTNVIELGFLDLDQLSRALGEQHDLHSALGKHFEKIDKDLQKLLSPEFAEKFSVVPLIKLANGKVIVCAMGPLEPKQIAIVADDMGLEIDQIIVTVAAELRIRYQLERAYNIPRSQRFLRARGPAFPQFATAPDVGETSDVDLPNFQTEEARRAGATVITGRAPPTIAKPRPATIDDLNGIPELVAELIDEAQAETEDEKKAKRTYVRTLSETLAVPAPEAVPEPVKEPEKLPPPPPPEKAPEPEAVEAHEHHEPHETEESKALGRIALRRIAAPTPPVGVVEAAPAMRPAIGSTLGEATRSIRRATNRDRVVDLMMMTVAKFALDVQSVLVLVVRGDAAITWRSYSRKGYAIPEIAVPLDQSPMAQIVVSTRGPARCVCDDLDAIDTLLYRALGGGVDGELVVIPVVIADQVMCLVAMVGAESSEVEAIAAAGGAAFARLMRDASR